MCGICGQFNFAKDAPASRETVRAMARSIAHRGPDDEGFHFDGGLGLGFRRLSIIDLSGGHQPMSDAQESIWVAFNGEIFNFPELRVELEGFGHRFRTKSDTEVIVHGYKQWGLDVFDHLNGMFGIAIWDARHQRLVVARDAMGIKLIYYRIDDGTVYFGSELHAVLAASARRPALDPKAVDLFLRYRYTPSPLTLYDGIRKLAPGTMAVFEDGQYRLQRWYHHVPRIQPVERSDGELAEELLGIYRRAVKRHLLSDVPVGLLLSGGVDSGLLLGLMSENGAGWPTYTVGYGREEYKDDELSDAAGTARIFGAKNHPVRIDRETFERTLPRIVAAVEEPIATSSIVPMYFVCQRARQDVKVALVGQGPDELFGGYTRHLGVQYGGAWRSLPKWMRAGVEKGVTSLKRSEAVQRGFDSLAVTDRLERYQSVFALMPGRAVDGLFRPGLIDANMDHVIREIWSEFEPQFAETDELGGFQLLELRSSLPDELLMYGDKLSMVHGLEVRVPYLDREIVEFAQSLPARFKVRWGRRKWLHREVCEQYLPQDILSRKKRGFAVDVVNDWFAGSLEGLLGSYLQDPASLMYSLLDPAPVRKLLEQHRSGERDNHKILFSLVVLEQWMRGS